MKELRANRPQRATLLRRWILGLAGAICLPALSAQTVWDGGGGDNRWATANNWNPNTVPGAATNVRFDNSRIATLPTTIELRGNRAANSLTFDTANPLSLINGTGSRTLTLTSGAITRTAASSGSQSLDMTTLALGANSTMDIAGTGALTISSRITGTSRSLTKTGAGELILSGSNTYTGGTTLSDGTLTLTNAAALGTGSLTLAGGTLRLSGVSLSLATLSITGNTIIDFAGSAATLSATTLTIGAGVVVTITNWLAGTDFFYAQNWVGATYDTTGSAPMNQVVFTGSTLETGWASLDNQVRPVPEPAFYGALLLGVGIGFLLWRRRGTNARTEAAA